MYLVHTVASKIKKKKYYIHATCSFTSSNVVFLAVRLALSVHIKVYSHFILSLWKVCRTGSCCTAVWRSELFSFSTLQKKKFFFCFFLFIGYSASNFKNQFFSGLKIFSPVTRERRCCNMGVWIFWSSEQRSSSAKRKQDWVMLDCEWSVNLPGWHMLHTQNNVYIRVFTFDLKHFLAEQYGIEGQHPSNVYTCI